MEVFLFVLSSLLMLALGIVAWAAISYFFISLRSALRVWFLFLWLWPLANLSALVLYTILHLTGYAHEPDTWWFLLGMCALGYVMVLPCIVLMVHFSMTRMYKSGRVLDEATTISMLGRHMKKAGSLHRLYSRLHALPFSEVCQQLTRSHEQTR